MRILHLSADYPDPLAPGKTKAVLNLLSLANEHEHHLWSLNRTDWRQGTEMLRFADETGDDHRAVAYGAPPKGLFHERYLLRLAERISGDCESRKLRPDVIHAHKLSVEGIVGQALAEKFGVPLVISIQGDSDLKIVGVKKGLRKRYSDIWRNAPLIFPFTPWARDRLNELLGERRGETRLLPCPGKRDEITAPKITGPRIVSAFHFASAKRKNAAALIRATGRAASEVPDIHLEIIGGGDPSAFSELSALARSAAPGRVSFAGAISHDEVISRMNGACGFALVSRRETFGMVFSEALLSGAPCLIPSGMGIDGYLPEGSVVISASADDEAAITAGLIRLVKEQEAMKARLAALGADGGLDFLRRDAIRDQYLGGLAGLNAGAV